MFHAGAAKQVGNDSWVAVNPVMRWEEPLVLAQPTRRCYRLGIRPAHPEPVYSDAQTQHHNLFLVIFNRGFFPLYFLK